MKPFLPVGKIVSTHGVRGELRINPLCDGPDFVCQFRTLYFDPLGLSPVSVVAARPHKNVALLKLDGVDNVQQGDSLRGRLLYFRREDAKLNKGQYFVDDIVGLSVVDAQSGRLYGTICEVSFTGANDVYHVKGEDGRVFLFPAVPQMIAQTDLPGGRLLVCPIEGIFDHEN